MTFVIVPNSLQDAINEKLDVAIAECPEAVADRHLFYAQLLEYFHEHGELPDFTLAKKS